MQTYNMDIKQCYKCRCVKPISEFAKQRTGRPMNQCRVCLLAHKKAYFYQPENRERNRLLNRAWYRGNKDRASNTKRKNALMRRYGITVADYDDMFRRQNGKCAMCGEHKKLGVDHNHTTGVVRGLLCSYCNFRIGLIETELVWFDKAREYLCSGV